MKQYERYHKIEYYGEKSKLLKLYIWLKRLFNKTKIYKVSKYINPTITKELRSLK